MSRELNYSEEAAKQYFQEAIRYLEAGSHVDAIYYANRGIREMLDAANANNNLPAFPIDKTITTR